jgi:hypothetical protein
MEQITLQGAQHRTKVGSQGSPEEWETLKAILNIYT